MPNPYTTLDGFNSFSDVDVQTTIKKNVISFFDWGFMNKGGFTSVRLARTNAYGNDLSVLTLVNDPGFSNGSVWACQRKNLVWESGLYTATQPIAISGVYVNGVFKTPTSSGYQHYVDYPNGRVVFSTPLATNSVVKMEYSYKILSVLDLSVEPIILYAQSRSLQENGDPANTLPQDKFQFPIVAVEMTPRGSFQPAEIGTARSQLMHSDVILHVLAENQTDAAKYTSFILPQKEKTIWLYNLTMMNKSGVMPLDYRGSPISGAMNYEQLVRDSANGGYRYNSLYFKDMTWTGPNPVGTIYHSAVRFTMENTLI